jgi:galactokinase
MRSFQSLFGKPPEFTTSASGRVNLIGEHTDYNGGFVLPCAIPQRTQIQLTARMDQNVRVASNSLNSDATCFEYVLGEEKPLRTWADYVQGVTRLLSDAGFALGGFEALIDSAVPMGSGLSSSAALEVSLMRALRDAFCLEISDVSIAQFGQRVENEFVGARVGIMDQMAASLAQPGSALFLDTRDLSYENIPLPENADLVVINSGISHSNAGGEYNTRRAECEEACRILKIRELRDLHITELNRLKTLSDRLMRRARHVVTENARVHSAVQAIRSGNLPQLGQLFKESHQSMRDDYQVSISEIDLLVELTCKEPETYGARLTGGGFGGSTVALTKKGTGVEVARKVALQYAKKTGKTPAILVPQT